ncbi:hypothetical protein EUX98_g9516 [Antrodiella citrinella]|uniref:Aldehyde dehydrogenase domain-containing protein n=1 Tax=Antrodiella citrinella TaxID=2447956 RepID=A0A4S4LT03_9APHY|nr:hypothetical protein EUX98_g9516 [Antrodiella citrinella]
MAFSEVSQSTITPHSQQIYVVRAYPSKEDVEGTIARSVAAQKAWSKVPLSERIALGWKFMEEFKAMSADIATELTWQMGRPTTQVQGEINGTVHRSDYMLNIAESSLADVSLQDTDKPGFKRYIKRTPLGVVLVIAPWNYPYLVSINAVLPALIAGNSVLFKPSPQTPLTAERFVLALTRAGLPPDLAQVLHLTPALTSWVVQHPSVDFVSFTGSVAGGRAVERAAVEAEGFKGVGLELGGKDPAYVRADADIDYTAEQLVDGAFFNSGQSCCSIERIYVHESVYDAFVSKFVALTKQYRLGDPTKPETTLGPVEETFGPVVGIQKVGTDAEAVALMNDSPYGLTASVWTNASAHPESQEAFEMFVEELKTGTVFLNRCDYLDPALAWTGVKNSGRGVSLSKFGYDQLTRAKSVHMKLQT